MIERLAQDFSYAFRNLVRRPAWTLAAVATLALGIGATTAIFSLVNDILLRPLPYPESERLIELKAYLPEQRRLRSSVSFPLCRSLGEAQKALVDFGCFDVAEYTVSFDAGAERMRAVDVSWQAFKALQVSPRIGRPFEPQDDEPGAAPAVLLSYGLWQERFSGDPEVLGKTLVVEERPYSIIGVMPQGFVFPDRGPRFWGSMAGRPRQPYVHYLSMLGRLRDDWTLAKAHAHFNALSLQIPTHRPGELEETVPRAFVLIESLVGEVRPQLLMFFSAVAAVLLIACLNVANLLLGRMADRGSEFALRSALGAGRGRLLLQVLSESVLLGLLGGAAGMGLALLLISVLGSMTVGIVPRAHLLGIDGPAVAFAVGISLLVGLLIAVPSIRASRPEHRHGLGNAGRGGTLPLGHQRLRASLVVVQIALAMTLLVNGGLLIRSLKKLASTDVGFETSDLLTIGTHHPRERYRTPERIIRFEEALFERVQALPQVKFATRTGSVPFGGSQMSNSVRPAGGPGDEEGEPMDLQVVDSGFFRVLGVAPLEGRLLRDDDREGTPPVAVVNRMLADRLFPQGDAIGRKLTIGAGADERRVEIVGIVPDLRLYTLTRQVEPMIFESIRQRNQRFLEILVRTHTGRSDEAVPLVRSLIRSLDSSVIWVGAPTLDDDLRARTESARFRTLLLSAFGIAALLLAAIGVYGVMTHLVTDRTREIGVRMALGASRRQILTWIGKRGLLLTSVGLLMGLAGARATAILLENYLHQLGVDDPPTYAAAFVLLLSSALLAAALPARRASRTEPMRVLRCE